MAVDGTLEVVAAVFDTPEPDGWLDSHLLGEGGSSLHVVAIEGYSNFISETVASIPTLRDIVVATSRDFAQIEDLNDRTSGSFVSSRVVKIGV